ncbi:helix-turn-helix domain-containing protein [Hespellia stercorisuis]|uniref:Transcriptional regulator, contains XRE-family HTH domain n=1 Tax=Hespellia stercorisuis DSM 15480 TaxID=1121950 RepID=A0A1M6TL87_9FIRM|nr:helix-turn-helix transcriptional regulator [Hespellia stercorisuis]SHK57656.1 Transcriptional regulator, contains XRE-family HTH domain [Hespellia stercorisuis DSM 15480]
MSKIVERLKEYRDIIHVSQEEMADMIGISVEKYKGWENGDTIYSSDLIRLTEATNVSCDYFAGNILFPLPPASEENNGLFYALFQKSEEEQIRIMRNVIEIAEEYSRKN